MQFDQAVGHAARRVPASFLSALLVVQVVSVACLSGTPAEAAGGLVVTPQLVELDSRNGSQVLTLANRGSEAETYRISIVNYRMDAQGNLHPTETPADGEGFAGALFRYAPRQVTLEPGRPQTVRILYRRPANLQDGEYRSHLMFQQVPKATPSSANVSAASGLSMQIQTVFGITVPVIIRHGSLEARSALSGLKPIEVGEGRPGIALRIARDGGKSLRGDLVATIGGDEVGRLNNVAVYLSTPHRDVVLPLDPARLPQAGGREVLVEYRERPEQGGAAVASGLMRLP